MPLKIVLVQGRMLPMPTAEPPRAIGPGKARVGLDFKYGNTGGKYRINTVIFKNGP